MIEEKRFEEESAKAITEEIVEFADGDDPVFDAFKTIIAPVHLTPREVLAQAYEKSPDELPERVSAHGFTDVESL